MNFISILKDLSSFSEGHCQAHSSRILFRSWRIWKTGIVKNSFDSFHFLKIINILWNFRIIYRIPEQFSGGFIFKSHNNITSYYKENDCHTCCDRENYNFWYINRKISNEVSVVISILGGKNLYCTRLQRLGIKTKKHLKPID